jgi:heavy metal translocating P-type ATPase
MAIFLTMNVMVFTMALWSQDVYPDHSFDTQFSEVLRSLFRWASLLFSAPVLWLLGGPIAQGVGQALLRRTITADLLILLGVGAAYAYSVISVLRGAGHVYFEVGSMVLVFVSLGRWLEAKGKRRTGESLDQLIQLLPPTVRRQESAGFFREVPRSQVVSGDVLRVLPGERFPVDGQILTGQASVDAQMVTGESWAAEKSVGDTVCSGTLNLDGDLQVVVTAADGQETISRLIALVRRARSVKGKHELLADRIAAKFVPTVCLIAVAAGWSQGSIAGWDQGILTGLAVVLIACPCALGLATPMAVWTALGRAAECGVLFRSGTVIERLASVRFACFDKTGTLTSGQPSVSTLRVASGQSRVSVLEVAAAVAAGSTHPLSQAITQFAQAEQAGGAALAVSPVETVAGQGLRCEAERYGSVVLGSRRWLEAGGWTWPEDLLRALETHASQQHVWLGWQGEVRAFFCLTEAVRPETPVALAACRDLGLQLQLLTGDSAARAQAIGRQLQLAATSDLLPDEKIAAVQTLAKQGEVAMIGEGLNDAPALAAATVGVALGCGADIARDAAGVCLRTDDLRRFPWAVGLARKTRQVITQNLCWAFTYNTIGIALAASGRLNPIWAALAMAVSSLAVITNSLRLSHYPAELPQPAEPEAPAAAKAPAHGQVPGRWSPS